MAEDTDALRAECTTFTRHLIDRDPTPHVLTKYIEAHELGIVVPAGGISGYDRALVDWAKKGGLVARAADIHARFFAPKGLLRRKLVLLLGIIETDPEGRAAADTALGESFLVTFLRLSWWGSVSVLLLFGGLVLFLPMRGRA